jgi:hypothetical protein
VDPVSARAKLADRTEKREAGADRRAIAEASAVTRARAVALIPQRQRSPPRQLACGRDMHARTQQVGMAPGDAPVGGCVDEDSYAASAERLENSVGLASARGGGCVDELSAGFRGAKPARVVKREAGVRCVDELQPFSAFRPSPALKPVEHGLANRDASEECEARDFSFAPHEWFRGRELSGG